MSMGGFEPTRFGQYWLVEPIGSGGMAEIFRAKTFGAAGFEKEYAIKRILPNLGTDEEFVTMFVNEAKLVVDLYHANIVQVFDLGEIGACYFIAMEFVQGKDLLDLLARCAETDMKIPLKLTLYIMMEMLKGLDFAHKAADKFGEPLNIIHRDVSPSNIMLSYAGDVKVGDFGVAKAKTSAQLTQVGTLKGKVGYMSPEQVRGDDIDHRSDIFSAGIILYETLTMSRLFMGGNDLDVMLKVRDADIEDDLSLCKKIPPTLLDILRKALSKDINGRFQSCDELYRSLRDFVFRHAIKTSNKDLAGFMHRVFRAEIAAEYERRRGETKPPPEDEGNDVPPSESEVSLVFDNLFDGEAGDNEIEIPRRSSASDSPAVETTYRYKDALGRIYGPMNLADLQALLSSHVETHEEAVSVDEAAWQSPDDLPQLWRVERPDPSEFEERVRTEVDLDAHQEDGEPAFAPTSRADERTGLHPSHVGQLGEITLARLLFRLARVRAAGMLRIESDEHNKEVFLRRGDPVLVTSSKPEELLGTYLVRCGVISEESLGKALKRLAEFGGRLGDALVGDRLISTNDLFRYLAAQLQERVLDLFVWSDARWAWFPEVQPGHQAVPLGVNLVDIILDGVRKKLTPEIIRAHFNGREDEPLVIIPSRYSPDDFPLTPNELAIALAIMPDDSAMQTLDNLAAQYHAEEEIVWRMIYLLTEFELFRLGPDFEEVDSLP